MKKKSIGIIGSGNHFVKNIYPVFLKNKFLKISAILRKSDKKFFRIPILSEKEFFKQSFDFVYISCPNILHEKFILKSLQANYHVICEKPFITSNKNISKIIKIAKDKQKLIFETFMYTYHPAFKYVKKIIQTKKYGKVNYVISNFRFPSLDKRDNRYKKSEGDGFFNDAASYLLSLESYLFENFNLKYKLFSKKIKRKVDLRGYLILRIGNQSRHYFWGEGQNYTNNIEIFCDRATIHIDKFFSKAKSENISVKIYGKNTKIINFKVKNQFELMFNKIFKYYMKKSFRIANYSLVKHQSNLINKFRK